MSIYSKEQIADALSTLRISAKQLLASDQNWTSPATHYWHNQTTMSGMQRFLASREELVARTNLAKPRSSFILLARQAIPNQYSRHTKRVSPITLAVSDSEHSSLYLYTTTMASPHSSVRSTPAKNSPCSMPTSHYPERTSSKLWQR